MIRPCTVPILRLRLSPRTFQGLLFEMAEEAKEAESCREAQADEVSPLFGPL